MIATLLSQVLLPLSLAIIMFGMGMTLTISDFTRILKFPKAVFIGLTNQLVILPIIGFILAIAFELDPIMAVGLMILAVSPGGPTSNLITQVCRGNIALSVTLTAIASCLSILTIPFILSAALDYFGAGTETVIQLPVLDTILQIMVITVIPISIGMFIRSKKPAFADRMENPMRRASTIIFVLVFVAVIAANWALLSEAFERVGAVTLALNLATMGIGYLTARIFNLTFADSISVTVESGIQNGTLAFVIATTILNNVEMGIPIGMYSIWMFITGGILMWQLGKKKATQN